MVEQHFTELQARLVEGLKNLGIRNASLLKVMSEIPRHKFVPEGLQSLAYENTPLPIGYEQTISQPYVVAFMIEAADISPNDTVLEIGTGSGYQAAVLAKLCKTVYTVEILKSLAYQASVRLQEMGCNNVIVDIDDGYKAHKSRKKFDAILVTAAPPEVPEILIKQLKIDGRLIIPVGEYPAQHLLRIIKTKTGIIEEKFFDVSFVPMVTKNSNKDSEDNQQVIK